MNNKIHIVQHEGQVISPFLTRRKATYAAGDKLVIEQPDGTQAAYDIDYVATDRVHDKWCYLSLHGPQGFPTLASTQVDNIPDSVGGGYGIKQD